VFVISEREDMNSKIIPPIYFIILFLLAIVSNSVFPIIKIVKAPYTYSGFIPIILGFMMAVWAGSLLKRENSNKPI